MDFIKGFDRNQLIMMDFEANLPAGRQVLLKIHGQGLLTGL